MSRKPWQLDRRTFLKGVGVSCMLPYMECMARAADLPAAGGGAGPPKRLCFVYFPNGVGLPPEESPHHRDWSWFPRGTGRDYTFTKTLSPLEPHRERLSVLGGLSHPNSRSVLGHIAGDTWLTGGDLRGSRYLNQVSVDQVAARALGPLTRYPCLTLSTDGGVGYKSRVATLAFDANGNPIPAEHRQRDIFERYFAPGGGSTTRARRQSLKRGQKIVDLVLQDSKRVARRLGRSDQAKMDEYLSSLNSVEQQLQRNERWLDIPLGEFDASHLDLAVDAAVDPEAYLRSTFDLMVLGFQLDLTRVMTFMMAREDGMGFGENFPALALGIKKGHHKISHDKTEAHWEEWGRYDRWLTEQIAYFIDKMQNTHDAHGPLLDSTLTLYGSACSNTHNARNYPLVLAGGEKLGAQHGAYTVFDEKHVPLSNLYVSMLNAVGIPTVSFADSNGPLPSVLA